MDQVHPIKFYNLDDKKMLKNEPNIDLTLGKQKETSFLLMMFRGLLKLY